MCSSKELRSTECSPCCNKKLWMKKGWCGNSTNSEWLQPIMNNRCIYASDRNASQLVPYQLVIDLMELFYSITYKTAESSKIQQLSVIWQCTLKCLNCIFYAGFLTTNASHSQVTAGKGATLWNTSLQKHFMMVMLTFPTTNILRPQIYQHISYCSVPN